MTNLWRIFLNQILKICWDLFTASNKSSQSEITGIKTLCIHFSLRCTVNVSFCGSWICTIQFRDEPSLKGREQHVTGDMVCRERDRKKKKRAKGGPGDLLSCDSYFLPNDRHVHIFTHRSRAVACVHCSPRVRLVSADRTVTGWKCSYPRCHLDQNFIQVWLVDISCGQLNWTSRQDWRFNSVMESSTVETIFFFFFGRTEYTVRISQHCNSNLMSILIVETFCKVIKWLLMWRHDILKIQQFSIS